jgi:hypothetical protein
MTPQIAGFVSTGNSMVLPFVVREETVLPGSGNVRKQGPAANHWADWPGAAKNRDSDHLR